MFSLLITGRLCASRGWTGRASSPGPGRVLSTPSLLELDLVHVLCFPFIYFFFLLFLCLCTLSTHPSSLYMFFHFCNLHPLDINTTYTLNTVTTTVTKHITHVLYLYEWHSNMEQRLETEVVEFQTVNITERRMFFLFCLCLWQRCLFSLCCTVNKTNWAQNKHGSHVPWAHSLSD